MNDIDFEELDRAINSVLSENEKKASAKNDPVKKNKSFKNENLSSNKNKSKNNNEKDNYFIDNTPIEAEDNNSNNVIANNLSSSTVQDSRANVDNLNHSKDIREDIKTSAVDIPQHFNSIIGGHDNNDNDLDKIESDKDSISADKVSHSNNVVPPLVLPHRTSYSQSGTQSSLHARSVFSRPTSVQSRAIFRDTKLDIDKNISGANSASPIAKSTQSEASISKHDSGFMENNALKNSRDIVGNFSVSSFSGSKKLSNDSSEEVIINKPTKLVTSSVNKEDVVSENNTDVDDSIVKDMTIKMVEELNAIKNESISEAQDKITIDNSMEKEHQSIDTEKQNQSSHHRDSTRKVGRFMDIMHPAMDMRHSHSIKQSVSVSSNLDNTSIGAENFHDTNLDNLDSKVGDNDNSLRVSDSENTIDDGSLVDEKTELKSHSDDSEELDSTTDLSTEHTYNNDNFNQQDDNQQSSNYDFIDDNYVDQYNTPNLTGDNTTVDVIDSTKDNNSDVHPIFDTESYTKPLTQNKQNKFNIWVALIVILIGLVIISIILLWKIIYA